MSGYEYWQSEPGLWTVGTRGPGGVGPNRDQHPESDWDSAGGAAEQVAMLNGRPAPAPEATDYLSDIHQQLELMAGILERMAATLDVLASQTRWPGSV